MRGFFEWQGHRWLCLVARLYLAFVFLYACWHKVLHPDAFAVDIATYQILPLALINPMAITLPFVEAGAGLMLLLGLRARAGALMVTGMLLIFIAAILIALYKGLNMSCGCFASQGAEEDPISYLTVLRDLGWLAIALYILFFDRRPIGLDALLEGKR